MMQSTKPVYDQIYTNIANYNVVHSQKDLLVDFYAKSVSGNILDAGCGQGLHLKRLLQQGFETLGLEMSTVCCEKYLQELPHVNDDIVHFSEVTNSRFSGVICMDVLEHIPDAAGVRKIAESLSKISTSVLFGIANHSDVLDGIELHLIQEDSQWWLSLLRDVFKHCHVYSFRSFEGMFFAIECSNLDFSTDKKDFFAVWDKFDIQEYKNHKIISSLHKKSLEDDEMIKMLTHSLEREKRITSHFLVKFLLKIRTSFKSLSS